MIAKMTEVQSVEGAEKYLERDEDNQGKERAGIERTGTHTKEEFNRLVHIVGPKAAVSPIDHYIFAHGASAHGPITTRRGNDIIAAFEEFAYAGLYNAAPSLWYRHFEVGGGFHDHCLALRFDFLSAKQFSLFPKRTDVYLLQLWQTFMNVRYGLADPFDPAFCREFARLPFRLTSPLQLLAERCKILLTEARDVDLIRNNKSGRDYLASVHHIQTQLIDGTRSVAPVVYH